MVFEDFILFHRSKLSQPCETDHKTACSPMFHIGSTHVPRVFYIEFTFVHLGSMCFELKAKYFEKSSSVILIFTFGTRNIVETRNIRYIREHGWNIMEHDGSKDIGRTHCNFALRMITWTFIEHVLFVCKRRLLRLVITSINKNGLAEPK